MKISLDVEIDRTGIVDWKPMRIWDIEIEVSSMVAARDAVIEYLRTTIKTATSLTPSISKVTAKWTESIPSQTGVQDSNIQAMYVMTIHQSEVVCMSRRD